MMAGYTHTQFLRHHDQPSSPAAPPTQVVRAAGAQGGLIELRPHASARHLVGQWLPFEHLSRGRHAKGGEVPGPHRGSPSGLRNAGAATSKTERAGSPGRE